MENKLTDMKGLITRSIWGWSLYEGEQPDRDKLVASANDEHKQNLYDLASEYGMEVTVQEWA
jgi:hypothetical protein